MVSSTSLPRPLVGPLMEYGPLQICQSTFSICNLSSVGPVVFILSDCGLTASVFEAALELLLAASLLH